MSGHSLAQAGAPSLFAALVANPASADLPAYVGPEFGGFMDRWIILWRGDAVIANIEHNMTADTAQEAGELIRQVLDCETCTDDEGEEHPAFDAFLEHEGCDVGRLPDLLQKTVTDIVFRCDCGVLTVVRDRVAAR
jgi:hypothetical protein